jgi:translation elongation factor EF-1beta
MSTIIAHPDSEQQKDVITAVLKALKVKFEVAKDKAYNADFVKKALESKKQAEEGNVKRISKEELQKFLGL